MLVFYEVFYLNIYSLEHLKKNPPPNSVAELFIKVKFFIKVLFDKLSAGKLKIAIPPPYKVAEFSRYSKFFHPSYVIFSP
jgi:hypothetical protein